MKIEIPIEYLNSIEVHNGYKFSYSDKIYKNRIELIRRICQNAENVIDLGCVGYIPNIISSIEKDIWVHKILSDQCKKVLGVDISQEGVDFCHKIGFNNVIKADIISDVERIKHEFTLENQEEKVDLIVIGEMLHEVDDPVGLLKNIRNLYHGFARNILITVPNIYRFQNVINALLGRDINHTENRFWFSPYTLCRVLNSAGIKPKEIYLAGKSMGKKGMLLNLFKNNICAENIVLIGEL